MPREPAALCQALYCHWSIDKSQTQSLPLRKTYLIPLYPGDSGHQAEVLSALLEMKAAIREALLRSQTLTDDRERESDRFGDSPPTPRNRGQSFWCLCSLNLAPDRQ